MSSSPDKTEERSMSDILASIRKIMAQDSAAAGPTAPSPAAAGGLRTDEPRLEAARAPIPEPKAGPSTAAPSPGKSPGGSQIQAAEAVSLDEFLALAAPLKAPGPAMAAPGAQPKPPRTDDVVTIPLLRTEASIPAPATEKAPEINGAQRPDTAPVHGPVAAAAPSKGPEFAAPSTNAAPATKAEPSVSGSAPDSSAPLPSPRHGPPPSVGDLGSVVPGQLDAHTRSPAAAPSREPYRPSPARPEQMPQASFVGPQLGPARGPTLPSAPPASAPRGPAPISEIPGADALRRLIADVVPPNARAPLPTPPRPVDDVPTEVVVPRAKSPESAPDMKVPETEPAPTVAPAAPGPPTKAEASARATETPKAAVPEPTVIPEATKVETAQAVASAKAETAPVTVSDDKASAGAAVAAPLPAVPAAIAVASSAGRTMDETVIELLRPLLREWLDKNMPRLIEPALKAELEALRAKLDEQQPRD